MAGVRRDGPTRASAATLRGRPRGARRHERVPAAGPRAARHATRASPGSHRRAAHLPLALCVLLCTSLWPPRPELLARTHVLEWVDALSDEECSARGGVDSFVDLWRVMAVGAPPSNACCTSLLLHASLLAPPPIHRRSLLGARVSHTPRLRSRSSQSTSTAPHAARASRRPTTAPDAASSSSLLTPVHSHLAVRSCCTGCRSSPSRPATSGRCVARRTLLSGIWGAVLLSRVLHSDSAVQVLPLGEQSAPPALDEGWAAIL